MELYWPDAGVDFLILLKRARCRTRPVKNDNKEWAISRQRLTPGPSPYGPLELLWDHFKHAIARIFIRFLTIVRDSAVQSARAQCCVQAWPPGAKCARAALTQLPPYGLSGLPLWNVHLWGIPKAAYAALATLPRSECCLACISGIVEPPRQRTKKIEVECDLASRERVDQVKY